MQQRCSSTDIRVISGCSTLVQGLAGEEGESSDGDTSGRVAENLDCAHLLLISGHDILLILAKENDSGGWVLGVTWVPTSFTHVPSVTPNGHTIDSVGLIPAALIEVNHLVPNLVAFPVVNVSGKDTIVGLDILVKLILIVDVVIPVNVVRVGDRLVVAQVNRSTRVEVLLTIIDDRLSEVVPSEDDLVVEPVVSLALLFKLDSLLELPAVGDFHVVVNCHRVIQDHVVVTDLDGVRVAIVCNDDCSEWVEHGLVDLSLVILVSDPPVSVVELPLDLG